MADENQGFEYIASTYAASVDTKAIHLYYERPHLCSLLPKTLAGKQILDIGCGSGWYAEYLHKAGANVTALDASPTMVELTKKRLNKRTTRRAIQSRKAEFLPNMGLATKMI